MINSPLNYSGNKYKLLEQLIPLVNGKSNCFVDVFAGSGLVGLNSDSDFVVLNDNNEITVQLLEYFNNNDSDKIISSIDDIILKYGFTDTNRYGSHYYIEHNHEGLSLYNKEPFNKLKNDYNMDPTVEKLFALIIFGFNHYIRFNSKGLFNVPVGKVDYSNSLRKKTVEYVEAFKQKEILITNKDFRDRTIYDNKNAIYYFDPPYLISQAPYNAFWSENDDEDLYNLLDELNGEGIKFALSNLEESNGKENLQLKSWDWQYNIHYLDRKYLNSNYRKKNLTKAKEVLVTNY